jgi:hypothetical protein
MGFFSLAAFTRAGGRGFFGNLPVAKAAAPTGIAVTGFSLAAGTFTLQFTPAGIFGEGDQCPVGSAVPTEYRRIQRVHFWLSNADLFHIDHIQQQYFWSTVLHDSQCV